VGHCLANEKKIFKNYKKIIKYKYEEQIILNLNSEELFLSKISIGYFNNCWSTLLYSFIFVHSKFESWVSFCDYKAFYARKSLVFSSAKLTYF